MKHLTSFLTLILFVCFSITNAQETPFYKDYNWEEKPKYNVNENSEESIITLKDKIVTEFFFIEDNSLVEYFLEHKVIWLNSDDKIEEYNKIYLPYSSTSNLEVNKARVITKDGKILELDESKILTAEDEETKRQYKYFAFEGIEKGSIIEYFYVVKQYPRYKGRRITFQGTHNKENVAFDLYAPGNLIFKFKSYNDLPEVVEDTLHETKYHWQLKLDKLKKIESESQAAFNASKQFLVYKLDYNTANNTGEISSYKKVAQNIYAYYYPEEYSKKEQTAISKLTKDILKNNNTSQLDNIRQIENYIKSNVFIAKASSEELENLLNVINNKVANETGIMKLYTALFRHLNIKHEIVITSDRGEIKFDKKFEANNFLAEFLFYFPKSKTYMSPSEIDSRVGFPPPEYTDNYGLFIKEISVGDYKSGLGRTKYIKPVKSDKTVDKMILDVDFDKDDLTINNINLKKEISGYYSMYIQPFLHLIKDEDRDELLDAFAKSINENVDIKDKKIVNDNSELFGIEPLKIDINFTSEAFVEKAGRKYLFKVGELIGPQMELYQEKERVLNVENDFQRSYIRTINITIPEGYEVANLDDIKIDNSFIVDDKEILAFHSNYTLNDNQLTITANEYYKLNIIDVKNYEDYRKVINSAADFNKVVLILESLK
ncbi:DUF3857 domain-containing protein [Pontimicrobium sp. IMCC45349]|uniref:DUF3857 domain-containing protein n=1 Tax=Pontimicrobium sp. IMCC45349 TaxID=3391574 RepID=UPI00399F3E12